MRINPWRRHGREHRSKPQPQIVYQDPHCRDWTVTGEIPPGLNLDDLHMEDVERHPESIPDSWHRCPAALHPDQCVFNGQLRCVRTDHDHGEDEDPPVYPAWKIQAPGSWELPDDGDKGC